MLVISLPVFNEATGISGFLEELNHHLKTLQPHFIVVDDQSTDSTLSILTRLQASGFPITVLRNSENQGHGQTVLRGLTAAVELEPTRIVLCDGDGQFDGSDIALLVQTSIETNTSIIEGVRHGRNDPWFRRTISFGTRILVFLSSGSRALDANTPLRVVQFADAKRLLSQIPADCPVPNLAMSALSRAQGLTITQIPVTSRPPRRQAGTTDHWKQKFATLPSRRLLKFVSRALVSWVSVHRSVRKLSKWSVNK